MPGPLENITRARQSLQVLLILNTPFQVLWHPSVQVLLNLFTAFTKSHSWKQGAMSAHFQLEWLCNKYRYPTNNLNWLFTSAVILRPACDCYWQVGEQGQTGNEWNHLLTLKITNGKVLGPGVNSTCLLQMTEWEFSKEKTYLKEFSKICFWCHGKTPILKQLCWLLDVSSRRHILGRTITWIPSFKIMSWVYSKNKRKNLKKEDFITHPSNARSSNRCFPRHHVIFML